MVDLRRYYSSKCASVDAEPNQFVHHGLGAVQAELLIVVIGAAIVGMTFDDHGQIVFLLEALGGKVNLAFAEVSQIGRIKVERHGWKNQRFRLRRSFPAPLMTILSTGTSTILTVSGGGTGAGAGGGM